MDDINDIRAGETYMLIYIRHKTDEEIKIEKEVSNYLALLSFLMAQFLY